VNIRRRHETLYTGGVVGCMLEVMVRVSVRVRLEEAYLG